MLSKSFFWYLITLSLVFVPLNTYSQLPNRSKPAPKKLINFLSQNNYKFIETTESGESVFVSVCNNKDYYIVLGQNEDNGRDFIYVAVYFNKTLENLDEETLENFQEYLNYHSPKNLYYLLIPKENLTYVLVIQTNYGNFENTSEEVILDIMKYLVSYVCEVEILQDALWQLFEHLLSEIKIQNKEQILGFANPNSKTNELAKLLKDAAVKYQIKLPQISLPKLSK